MQSSDHILDVSESDFEVEVLQYSEKKPVVVDFWAEWCGPCRLLGPLLESLAEEGGGSFRLAKIHVDRNPNLAKRYNIRSIPAVKAFKGGRVVAEFHGLQPEPRVREFVRSLGVGDTALQIEKGQAFLYMQRWKEAETTLRQFLQENPRQPAALLGLAKSLLLQGKPSEAYDLLRTFPDSKELASSAALLPLAKAMASYLTQEQDPDDVLDAAYRNALRLASRGNLLAAMDGVLDVLRQDKRFRGGEARQVVVGLLEVMDPDDTQTRQYRNELASVLF
jgi:putative thioredoxin